MEEFDVSADISCGVTVAWVLVGTILHSEVLGRLASVVMVTAGPGQLKELWQKLRAPGSQSLPPLTDPAP